MSRQTVIDTAASQNGVMESPPDSNKTKYGAWFGDDGQKWCAMFVSWVFNEAGHPLGRIQSSKGYEGCQTGFEWFTEHGFMTHDPQPGDIVFYDWDKNGHIDHTGIFESWTDDTHTTFNAWEGNTSLGNDSNGGEVMRRQRNKSVAAFASPPVYGE